MSYLKALKEGENVPVLPQGKKVVRVELPDKVVRLFLNIHIDILKTEVERCFSRRENGLIRHRSRKPSQIIVSKENIEATKKLKLIWSLRDDSVSIDVPLTQSVLLPKNEHQEAIESLTSLLDGESDSVSSRIKTYELISYLDRCVIFEVARFLTANPLYLPAERAGILHANSMVVASILNSAARVGTLSGPQSPMLSGVIADFLEKLILGRKQNSQLQSENRPLVDIASEIETTTLGGSIHVQRDEMLDYPQFQYTPLGWKKSIPLLFSSSMVSELAPVIVFLRECVSIGDFLIIEEPEAHLHPAHQVQFIRLLAHLVNVGVRVLITTHSEWITEELSNVVNRSRSSTLMSNSESKETVFLSPDKVGVWLFHTKESKGQQTGSKISEIQIDESGLFPTGFDDIAIQLHNEWANSSTTTS